MRAETEDLIQRYYACFNARDVSGLLSLLDDEVVHDINQGAREIGKPAFERFLVRMNRCYRETLVDLVVMTNDDGSRAAAEFRVLGVYDVADEGLPPACGQRYVLPAGAFFQVRDGRIARVTNYYNLDDWLRQVGSNAALR